MKKLVLMLLAVILIGSYGCKKDDQTYCFECTEYELTYENGYLMKTDELETNVFCGLKKSQEGLLEFESLVYNDGFTSVYRVQSCQQKEEFEGAVK